MCLECPARAVMHTTTTAVVPIPSSAIATPAMVVFVFVHAITFNAPFTRVKVEVEAAAPLASATAEMVLARPAGAAWTELAEIAPAMARRGIHAAFEEKLSQFFQGPRDSLFCGVFARAQYRADFAPIPAFIKSQNDARRSFSPKRATASSSSGSDLRPNGSSRVHSKRIAYRPPVHGAAAAFRFG